MDAQRLTLTSSVINVIDTLTQNVHICCEHTTDLEAENAIPLVCLCMHLLHASSHSLKMYIPRTTDSAIVTPQPCHSQDLSSKPPTLSKYE
jgi:hypothetical protein